VVTVSDPDCLAVRHVSVTQPFGYLSSYITESRGYGSLTCPWRIELQRGERINITLIDFTTPRQIIITATITAIPAARYSPYSITPTLRQSSLTCHGLCRSYLDMSRWFKAQNFRMTHPFHGLRPWSAYAFTAGMFC